MKKILNYFGAILFVALLGINVYYSLEDPMLFASEEALAQANSCGGGTGSGSNKPGDSCEKNPCISCASYETVYFDPFNCPSCDYRGLEETEEQTYCCTEYECDNGVWKPVGTGYSIKEDLFETLINNFVLLE